MSRFMTTRILCSFRHQLRSRLGSLKAARSNTGVGRIAVASAITGMGLTSFVLFNTVVKVDAFADEPKISQNSIPEKHIELVHSKDTFDPNNDNAQARVERLVRRAQHRITYALAQIEGADFEEKIWERKKGQNGESQGGGFSRTIQDGNVIQKGGVNVTISKGLLSPPAQKQMMHKNDEVRNFLETRADKNGDVPFYSGSISSVVHPRHPHAPTVHFNYRYFELGENDSSGKFVPKVWWFGGGCDLTPVILYEEDAKHFHSVYKKICDKYDPSYYPTFKRWCDRYFHIKHREECRGVGGIFFDDLTKHTKDHCFHFIDEMANAFIDSYIPILQRRYKMDYTEEEYRWQQIRRSRYTEFNLVYDRGTKFGLNRKGANVEAILMSLPLTQMNVTYNVPEKGYQQDLVDVLKNPRDWVPFDEKDIDQNFGA